MTLRDRLQRLTEGNLIGAVVVLVGGTAVAHGVTAAALPIVTRLYSPADFSVLAVFAGLLSIASVAACLRFDLAIPIPEQDSQAADLLALALSCTVGVAAVVAAAVLLVPTTLIGRFTPPGLGHWLWLLPVAVLLAGSYSALQMWFLRKKAFMAISHSRVAQSSAAAGTQLGMGWMGLAPLGLILGQMLNTGAGCAILGYGLLKRDRDAVRAVTLARMRSAFAAYDRFPKYSTLEALCNSASIQLPIVVIAAVSIGPEAGYLALAMTAMQIPMGLIGTAVSQVYLSRAPEEHRAGRLDEFTTSVFGGLLRSGVGPLVFVGLVAPALFPLLFGTAWHRAGVLVAWMTPWFIMQFVSVPVSMALHITGHQRAAFVLQVFALVLRMGAVYGASLVAVQSVSEAYAISGAVFYLAYLLTVLVVVSARPAPVVQAIWRATPIVLVWAGAALVVALAARGLGLTTA